MRLVNRALAVLLGCVASPVAGCVGARYVNTTLYGPTRKPQVHTDVMVVPDVPPAALNGLYLEGVPTGVQAQFQTDHPDAVVTAVRQQGDGRGLMLYEVDYVEDGSAGQALYYPSVGNLREPGTAWSRAAPDDAIEAARRAAAARAVPTTRPTTRDIQARAGE